MKKPKEIYQTHKGPIWAVAFVITALLALYSQSAHAQIQTFIVSYSVPAQVSHTLSYGSVNGTCSSTTFWFIENDATLNGNQLQLNVSDSASNPCQNNTVAGLVVVNTGNVRMNVTLELNQSALTGVITKSSINSSGYQGSCSGAALGSPSNTTCKNVTHSAPAILVESVAPGGNQSVWIWADFVNADLGNGTNRSATATRIISTNSTSTV